MDINFNDFQKTIRKQFMPSGERLAELAQKKLEMNNIEKNFNLFLKQLLKIEFDLYKEFEKKCTIKIFDEAFKQKIFEIPKDDFKKTFSDFFNKYYNDFWNVFLSISQSRKARAGGSFERHLEFLFSRLNYPYATQTQLNGRVDYLFPSEKVFTKNRTSCLIISVKRTLRERWRQVVGELASIKADKIYIVTQEQDISEKKIKEMEKHNIDLVVFDEEKEKNFSDHHNVISFTDLVSVHFPAKEKLWNQYM
ncbi:MAG: hypothetical protein HQ534_05055 [Armatimonadetes bacterium]|nr:hypothetical protein [Armatimonadota bacterium]